MLVIQSSKMPTTKYVSRNPYRKMLTHYRKKRLTYGRKPTTLAVDAPAQINPSQRGVAFPRYNQPTPFPPRWRIKMSFSETATLTASIVNTFGSERVYRLNTVFQPSYTGSTVRPYGYTQMASLYQTFRVYAVNMDMTFSNPTEVEGTGMTVGALLQNSQGTNTLAGQTYNTASCASGGDLRQLNNTGTQIVRIQRRFTIPQIENMTYQEWVANSDYTANTGANPSATPFLRVAVLNDTTLVATSCTLLANLTYEVEWYNRLDLS